MAADPGETKKEIRSEIKADRKEVKADKKERRLDRKELREDQRISAKRERRAPVRTLFKACEMRSSKTKRKSPQTGKS
jgi:hypothetical protein